MDLEIIKIIQRAQYHRLRAMAEKTKRSYDRGMNDSKISLIKDMYLKGIKNNKIACQLSLTKEYVDAVVTTFTNT